MDLESVQHELFDLQLEEDEVLDLLQYMNLQPADIIRRRNNYDGMTPFQIAAYKRHYKQQQQKLKKALVELRKLRNEQDDDDDDDDDDDQSSVASQLSAQRQLPGRKRKRRQSVKEKKKKVKLNVSDRKLPQVDH
ncbi:unnamed protein product [Cunninghamella blakesleeana]